MQDITNFINLAIDIVTRASGVAALCIITIPKFTELVLQNRFSVSLEHKKKELQAELEGIKNKLAMDLEDHKNNLQKNINDEQRKYDEAKALKKNISEHQLEILSTIHSYTLDALNNLSECPKTSYGLISELLNKLFNSGVESNNCIEEMRILDEIAERPAALTQNSHFVDDLKSQLCKLDVTIKCEISNIKRGRGEI